MEGLQVNKVRYKMIVIKGSDFQYKYPIASNLKMETVGGIEQLKQVYIFHMCIKYGFLQVILSTHKFTKIEVMGDCVSKQPRKFKKSQTGSTKENEEQVNTNRADPRQLFCLRLIYDDLVSRTPDRKMNTKIFQIFFHMNPTFGGSLFRKFSKTCGSQITEEIFIQSVLRYFKENVEEKLKFLFSLYDIDESRGVCFNEFIAILLSSPQEELKEILSNDSFLETLTVQEMSYYLVSSKKLDSEKLQKQYISNMSLYPYLPQRRKTSSNEYDPNFLNMKQSLQIKNNEEMRQRKYSAQSCKQSKQLNLQTTKQIDQKSEDSQQQHMNKNRQLIQQELKKKIDKSIHCTQILRKYAQYIFKKNSLNKEHDEISYEKFRQIIKQNPKLYRQCFEGFHQYLWLHQNGISKYKTTKPTITGYCTQCYCCRRKNVYMVNIKNSLMIFDNENMNKLLSIKNLQGLNIEPKENQSGFGFVLKHQDGYYPQRAYIFNTKEIQKEWLEALQEFQEKNVFKKYKLEQKIGQGSFCNVYRCTNLQNGEKRAIKIFDKTIRTAQQIEAVNSQSQMLATCVMPHVIRAYERFETKTHIYIIMELVEGGTLFQYVNKEDRKNFSQKQARRIMRALLQTIKNLHEIGIIHRDLKLQNILMKQEDGKFIPKIIDFGLAIYKIELPSIQQKRKFVGTPNFVPPEIFFHDQYDETVDVFSLGVILHFMLTGTLPFHGLNLSQIRQLTIDCHLNFEAKKWRKVSEQAKDLVSQMICYRDYRINAAQALDHQWFTQNHQ